MASKEEISDVTVLLPGDAEINGEAWDETKVGRALDEGKTKAKILSIFWHAKAAEAYATVDVSESGSSRSFSNVYKNALELARYWDDQVKREEAIEEPDLERGRIAFHRVKRV